MKFIFQALTGWISDVTKMWRDKAFTNVTQFIYVLYTGFTYLKLTAMHSGHIRSQINWVSEVKDHIHFFDVIPHVLASRPSNSQLTVKRRPPRESQGNSASNWRGGLFKNFWTFFMHKVLSGNRKYKYRIFHFFRFYAWYSDRQTSPSPELIIHF